MPDKVKFGVKNVHYAMFANGSTDKAPAYDAPKPIPGAVALSMEPNGDSTPFYADNRQYFMAVANNGYTGDLEMALFPVSFMRDVFGYTESTNDKVVTEKADVQPKPFALLFEEEGDATGTKYVAYSCMATRPARSLATTTDTKEPQTQTVSLTMSPLADGRTISYTTDETPADVSKTWYSQVWLADSSTEG